LVKLLAAHEEWRFEVQGHTDNAATPAQNLALSDARARAVVAWLTGHGVAPARLVARGYGDTKPLESNETDDGRVKNRRIQLKKLNEE
jgi:outer membrane protein OmpA-like peptidoglycan-associated protein